MKHFFALLLFVLTGQTIFAQTDALTTERMATNRPKDPVLGPKEAELNHFATQLQRLQTAYANHETGQVTVHHSTLLTAMRTAMDTRRSEPLAIPSAAQDLEKMQQIFAVFENFVGFDVTTPQDAAVKFNLLADFQQVLQNQYDTLKQDAKKN